MLNMLLAVFLGTLLGVGLGFLVELLDRRVRSGQDIVAGLEIPVLGEVSKNGRVLESPAPSVPPQPPCDGLSVSLPTPHKSRFT